MNLRIKRVKENSKKVRRVTRKGKSRKVNKATSSNKKGRSEVSDGYSQIGVM